MKKYLLPTVETKRDWSPIFTDVGVWEPVIREICSQEGLSFSQMQAGYPGTHAVFILDRKYVIKVYAPFWRDFHIEPQVHSLLSENSNLPLPGIVTTGVFMDRIEWPYLITEFVQGTAIWEARHRIDIPNLLEVAAELGQMIRTLHQTDVTAIQSGAQWRENWLELLQRRGAECITEVRQKAILSQSALEQLQAFLQRLTAALEDSSLTLVHGDLTEDNLLLKEGRGKWRIAGLIDFGDAKIGVREYKWPPLWFDLLHQDVEAMRIFLNAYDPSMAINQEFLQQCLAWTLLHDFGSDIIDAALNKADSPPTFSSLNKFREFLWPSSLVV